MGAKSGRLLGSSAVREPVMKKFVCRLFHLPPFLLLISLVVSATLAVLERYAGGIWGGSATVLAAISSLMFFFGAEFTRQYALWFGSLQHERRRFLYGQSEQLN